MLRPYSRTTRGRRTKETLPYDGPTGRCPAEAGHRLTGSYSGGIEAKLQQLQPVVVILPEEVLEARAEETDGHGHRSGRRRRNEPLTNEALRERRCEIGGVDGERYRCRREIGGHVLERALALLATDGELSRRRAEGPGVESREPAAKRIRAGHHLGRATRLGELARPDG